MATLCAYHLLYVSASIKQLICQHVPVQGLQYPITAAVLGMVWNVGRIMYTLGKWLHMT